MLPRVEEVLLATLLALRNRCSECIPLEVSELRSSQPKAYRPGSPVVQLRVPADTLARIDGARGQGTRSAWVRRLLRRELHSHGATPAPPATPLFLPPPLTQAPRPVT